MSEHLHMSVTQLIGTVQYTRVLFASLSVVSVDYCVLAVPGEKWRILTAAKLQFATGENIVSACPSFSVVSTEVMQDTEDLQENYGQHALTLHQPERSN